MVFNENYLIYGRVDVVYISAYNLTHGLQAEIEH